MKQEVKFGEGGSTRKLEENISQAMLVEEGEAGRSPQEVLLDEEQEVLRDDPAPPLQLWKGCRHCFQNRPKMSPRLHAEELHVAAPWAKCSWSCHHRSPGMDQPM